MNVMVYRALRPKPFTGLAALEIQDGLVPCNASSISWSKGATSQLFIASSERCTNGTSESMGTGIDKAALEVSTTCVLSRMEEELVEFENLLMPLLSPSDKHLTDSHEEGEVKRWGDACIRKSCDYQEHGMYDAISEEISDDEDGDEEDVSNIEPTGNTEANLVKKSVGDGKKPAGYDLVRDILRRCCYFLSASALDTQVVMFM